MTIRVEWWWSDICSGDSCCGDDISDNKELECGWWMGFWFGVGIGLRLGLGLGLGVGLALCLTLAFITGAIVAGVNVGHSL